MRPPFFIPAVSIPAAIAATAVTLVVMPSYALDIAPDLGGFVKLQYGAFDRKAGIDAHRIDGEAHLNLTATGDTGIEYEGRVQVVRAYKSRDNASYLSMKAAWGTLRLGDAVGAAGELAVSAPTVGIGQIGGDLDAFGTPSVLLAPYGLANDDSSRLTYLSPEIATLRFGLSYAPELASTGLEIAPARHPQGIDAHRNIVEAAAQASRDIGETTLIAGVSYVFGQAKAGSPLSDLSGFGVGLRLAWNGFTLGGGYVYDGAHTLPLDRRPGRFGIERVTDEFDLGLSYEADRWGVGLSWAHDERSSVADSDLIALGATYRIAHGVTIASDIGYFTAPVTGLPTHGVILVTEIAFRF